VLDYAASSRWKFDFAPHDLGTYPKANGQVYGGGEVSATDQMPVEESGNLLILVAAYTNATNDLTLATQYWPQLTKWAEYLKSQGFDPANQLSTDDFTGHLAHNANLSLKAIIALGAYAKLCAKRGLATDATTYATLSQQLAAQWTTAADDGDHYRLAFDKPNTYSQKYNLVWDHLLGLDLFVAAAKKETSYYLTRLNTYGLPLDNRATYTKLDWEVWTSMIAQDPDAFKAFASRLGTFIAATPDRVPLTDWYQTTDATKSGFQARSVVGGVFLPLLYHADIWQRWLARAQ
jgi:glutaminase A-like protein